MTSISNITEAETTVLEQLWSREPMTAAQIAAALAERTDWHRKTVNTLISRLVAKGALRFEEQPGGRRYFAVVKRPDFTGEVAENVVDRFFGGKVAPLVAHFAQGGSLSQQDVDELKAILEKMQ